MAILEVAPPDPVQLTESSRTDPDEYNRLITYYKDSSGLAYPAHSTDSTGKYLTATFSTMTVNTHRAVTGCLAPSQSNGSRGFLHDHAIQLSRAVTGTDEKTLHAAAISLRLGSHGFPAWNLLI
jgi:hypothetical protein